MILPDEKIKEAVLPILKSCAEANNLLGKRFIDGDITCDEYVDLGVKLSQAYELIYEKAIAQSQVDYLLSLGWLPPEEVEKCREEIRKLTNKCEEMIESLKDG